MPSFREALLYWLKLGFISFGGPAGQIAIMHQEMVEKRKWITESHFLHALNFCMLLPGPEAQQLATYLGWRLHGWKGGVAAGSLFVLPSALMLFFLAWLYMAGGHIPWLAAIFYGLMPAVIAVIADAVLRIGGKTLRSGMLWLVALLSFVGIYFFDVSFVIIIFGAALIGWLGHRWAPEQFRGNNSRQLQDDAADGDFLTLPASPKPTLKRAAAVIGICFVLWSLPIVLLGLWLGWASTPVAQGLFFSKAALVTFGGAYAVLPYVAQQAVEGFSWLTHQQMMSGLALAETTPGPLIIVLQFVGFVGGWQHPGNFSPLMGAGIGALITVWATFVPCFLFVFLGAPYVEKLRDLPRIGSALRAITAAVVGVILNLGVVFAGHALWSVPEQAGPDVFVLAAAIAAFIAMWKFKVPFTWVLAVCGLLGLTSLL
ncbi:chromate efflux transporter [Luteolibacter algae]|uniref:Chromate efflux transporter n=1 Tax=Luteolibacter algae TaxID=454151 RepID=A0ABW5D9U5_9BACT